MNYNKLNIWSLKGRSCPRFEYFANNEKMMVSGGISRDWKSKLKVWIINSIDKKKNVRVNSLEYLEFIYDLEYEIGSMRELPPLPIPLQLDVANPHKKYTREYLDGPNQNLLFNRVQQPPSSPDLNAIEVSHIFIFSSSGLSSKNACTPNHIKLFRS
jgi:hypothetical protein